MSRRVLAVVALSVLTSVTAAAQTPTNDPPALSTGAVAAQVTTGILGTALGFIGGGKIARWTASRLGASEDNARRVAYLGAYAGAVTVTAVGPALIGSRGDVSGSYGSAVGGAAAGGVLALGIKEIGKRGAFGASGPVAWIAGLVVAALPSVGATIAYNATR